MLHGVLIQDLIVIDVEIPVVQQISIISIHGKVAFTLIYRLEGFSMLEIRECC